jgi:hypothetical protein
MQRGIAQGREHHGLWLTDPVARIGKSHREEGDAHAPKTSKTKQQPETFKRSDANPGAVKTGQ